MQSNPGILENLFSQQRRANLSFCQLSVTESMDFQWKFSFRFYLFVLDTPQDPSLQNHFQNSPFKKDNKVGEIVNSNLPFIPEAELVL